MITNLLATAAKGFCMGAADIVPGVSGGTIALVFGIYERLLSNVRMGAKALGSFAKLDVSSGVDRFRSVEWDFILPLAAGLGVAVLALSSIIDRLLEEAPEAMAGLFLGLVLGSIIVAWRLVGNRGPTELGVMLAVGLAAFYLLGFQSGPVSNPALPVFFGAGAIAICAMILPGISGSFLLLMMGMYAAVLGAAHELDFGVLAVFGLGAVVGLAFFSTGLGWLLDQYHDLVLSALIGLMIGSFRVLWPWPHGVGIISDVEGESIPGTGLELPTSDQWLLPTALAVVAFVVVVGVSRLAPTAMSDQSHNPPVPKQAKIGS